MYYFIMFHLGPSPPSALKLSKQIVLEYSFEGVASLRSRDAPHRPNCWDDDNNTIQRERGNTRD
jgi:hypothetical protein